MKPRKGSPKATKMSPRETLMSDLMKNRLYDSKEVCELLGISLQTLRRAIALKKITTVRLGHFLRIPASEVERLVQGEEVLLNVKEAAELLSISEGAIRTLINDGKIRAFRFASKGAWRIAKSEVEQIAQKGISQ